MKIVKSVARVLEILELYNEVQEPMAAVDVAERLNYPLASTHEILKTMVELGFFTYGEPKWTYTPSSRFPETVDWVKSSLSKDSNIYSLMETLNSETKETINLSCLVGTRVKIAKGLECQHEIGVSSRPGTMMNATHSLTGIAALSHLSTDALNEFLTTLKVSDPEAYQNTDTDLMNKILNDIREKGCAMQGDINIKGIGAVCCPIVSKFGEAYVVGIVGPSDRIRENQKAHMRALKIQLQRNSVKSLYKIKV